MQVARRSAVVWACLEPRHPRVDVVTWNELAEKAQQSLTKGTKIQVQGYLNQSGNGRLQARFQRGARRRRG